MLTFGDQSELENLKFLLVGGLQEKGYPQGRARFRIEPGGGETSRTRRECTSLRRMG